LKSFKLNSSLIVIVCLFKAAINFGQVVKVPPNCEVVFAGTGNGATTGFGGAVGDGGIVAMPDPFDFQQEEGNFHFASNGAELIEWALFGDLSMQTDSDYNEVLQPLGAVNPVNLQSYNKNLRFTEMPSASQPDFDARWARSKGRVIVSFSDKRCVGKLKFDVFKRYKNDKKKSRIPPILGLDCLLPHTTYTFSVDPIASDNANDEIGFDKYYWSGLPEGSANIYTSADNSSITFSTGDSVPNCTITCCYGRANDWDGDADSPTHSTCITKSVGGQPAPPVFSTEPPACLDTGITSFMVSINPGTIVAGASYTWSAPGTGWQLTPGGMTSGQTLNVSLVDNNPGVLTLTIASGNCLPAVYTYPINRSYNNLFAITGTTCVSGGNTYGYSLPLNGLLNPTTWLAPAGWTVTQTNGTASAINISIPNTVVAGDYELTAKSNSCPGTTSLAIHLQPAIPVFASTTPTCVPLSSPAINSFAVVPVAGALSYTWTLPPGWSCSSNCNSPNPTLIPPSNNFAVGAETLAPATISVEASSGTGCSSAASTSINYIRINTNTIQSGAGNCDQYSINTNGNACVATISSWTVGGVTAVSNGSTVNIFGNTLTLCGNTSPTTTGTVCANLIINGVTYNTCSSTVATGSHSLKAANPKVVIHDVIISPNPNSGNFNIRVLAYNRSASATLVDFSGNEIQTYQLRTGDNKIEKEGLKGTYFLILKVDDKQETRQIIVK
jgi:hypothetical protein